MYTKYFSFFNHFFSWHQKHLTNISLQSMSFLTYSSFFSIYIFSFLRILCGSVWFEHLPPSPATDIPILSKCLFKATKCTIGMLLVSIHCINPFLRIVYCFFCVKCFLRRYRRAIGAIFVSDVLNWSHFYEGGVCFLIASSPMVFSRADLNMSLVTWDPLQTGRKGVKQINTVQDPGLLHTPWNSPQGGTGGRYQDASYPSASSAAHISVIRYT